MTSLIAQREVFRGKITYLTVDTVDLPNGHRADLEILHHPGGAAIVDRKSTRLNSSHRL